MYCPECQVEFRDGFTECSDCRVALLPGKPPLPDISFDTNMDLVVVLETDDPITLAFAKGTLQEAGIPFYVFNEISTLVNDIDPMLHKWFRVQVACDREAAARELLAPMPQSDAEEKSL